MSYARKFKELITLTPTAGGAGGALDLVTARWGLIPIGVPQEPREDFRSFVAQASQKNLHTGRLLDESTFHLSHDVSTTASLSLN